MDAIALPLRALLDPFGAVPKAVEARKWLIPLILLGLTTAVSGVAVATRLDASRLVIPKMEASGELGKASEREIDEQVQQTQRVAIVGGVAAGLFLVPLELLAIAVALKIVAWLLGRKAAFAAVWTVAAVSALPFVLDHLVTAAAALNQPSLSPKTAAALLPSSLAALSPDAPPHLARVLGAVDFFNLWAALLLGIGFGAATKLPTWKGVLLGLFLYVLFAAAALVGLPGLAGQAGGGMGGPK